jgi:uncharacterized membrane protein
MPRGVPAFVFGPPTDRAVPCDGPRETRGVPFATLSGTRSAMSQRKDNSNKTFIGDFKQFFGRGLAIVLPSVLTLWILFYLVVFLYNNVGRPINQGVRVAVLEVMPRVLSNDDLPAWFKVTPEDLEQARERNDIRGIAEMSDDDVRQIVRREKFRDTWNQYFILEASGLVIAIVLIYFAGLLLGGFIGRRVYGRIENFLKRIPVFKQIYPHVKQLTEMILGENPLAFNRVVLVEYPRKGIWTVGLVTGDSLKSIRESAGTDTISVFIPSTPTPFTGFTITVSKTDAIDLPIGVDEAIRFFITGASWCPTASCGAIGPKRAANSRASRPNPGAYDRRPLWYDGGNPRE